jgi:ketosteroid isomerase-like protein
MRPNYAALLTVLVVASSCTSGSDGSVTQQGGAAPNAAAVRQSIEAGNAALIAALQKGDSLGAAAVYDDSGMVMPSEMPAAAGRAGIVSFWSGMSGMFTVSNMKLTVGDVVASGDLASETGRFELTLTPKAKGGKPILDKGKYLVVWKKQADGSYKMLRDMWNSDAPAAPAK